MSDTRRHGFTAESRCPDCGQTNAVHVQEPARPLSTIRTRAHCACGRSYAVELERRCGVRKQVTIHGEYRRRGDARPRPMTIRNLSRSGLMFEVDDQRTLRPGERVEVDFSFGRPEEMYVRRQAKVLRRDDGAFAAEFTAGKSRAPLSAAEDLALALFNPDIKTL